MDHISKEFGAGPRLPAIVMDIMQIAAGSIVPKSAGVTQAETQGWLLAYAFGVKYVHEKYGTAFTRLALPGKITYFAGEELREAAFYDGPSDTAAITRGFITREIRKTRGKGAIFGHENAGFRYNFTGEELATLLGVEQAFHAWQYKLKKSEYADEEWDIEKMDARADKDSRTKLEIEAKKAVLEAIVSLGMAGHSGSARSSVQLKPRPQQPWVPLPTVY